MLKRNETHKKRYLCSGLLTAVWLCLAAPAFAAAPTSAPPQQPLLEADHLSFDEQSGVMTAIGNVEIGLSDKVLRADKVTYNKNNDVVQATGHVAVTESSGQILYADQMEVTADMKQGFIDKIGMMFPDNSRMVAKDAQRYEGRYMIADRGVYTACDLCKDDPKAPPLWQLKGKRITHDSEAKNIIYRDATIEFNGLPVFYTPYFSHPDPTVRRRQGFLTPSGGMDNTLGTLVRTPYYFDIAPNSDLVVTPLFSTVDKLQVEADWRYRFENGDMRWTTSAAKTEFVNESGINKGRQWRGHLFGFAEFDITNTWRTGTNLALTTDKSYLPRYKYGDEEILVNRAYVENFKGRNYAAGNVYYFKDIRPGNQLIEPLVAPELRYSAFGEPNKTLGGRWSFDSSLLVTSRRTNVAPELQGASTRRASFNAGWERQLVSSVGFLTTVSGLARTDSYWADNVPDPNAPLGSGFSSVVRTRPFAQGNINIRYPLGRSGKTYLQLLEPIAVVSVAPRVSQKNLLPNEDSLDAEFDETNLFLPNRFTGNDRVEGGTRLAYGIRHALIGHNGGRIEMLGGQVFRMKRDTSFPDNSGLTERFSDYVGRVDLIPAGWLSVNYGFRLNRDDLAFNKQELQASAGAKNFRPYVNYLSVQQLDDTTGLDQRVEEATVGFSSNFIKYWSFAASHKQAFSPAPGPRRTTLNLTYEDECFKTGVVARQDHTDRVDVEPERAILFQFYLRNIGGFSTE